MTTTPKKKGRPAGSKNRKLADLNLTKSQRRELISLEGLVDSYKNQLEHYRGQLDYYYELACDFGDKIAKLKAYAAVSVAFNILLVIYAITLMVWSL